jgi:hypothetical protein
MRVEQKTHWHNGYPNQVIAHQKRACDGFIELFKLVAPTIDLMGFKVFNLFRDSSMNCFPFEDLEEVIK